MQLVVLGGLSVAQ